MTRKTVSNLIWMTTFVAATTVESAEISRRTFSSGGETRAAQHTIRATLGEDFAGTVSSVTHTIRAGFVTHATPPTPGMPGDYDGDGDVDLDDWSIGAACETGPVTGTLPPGCQAADLDADGDVDLADFAQFQQYLGG